MNDQQRSLYDSLCTFDFDGGNAAFSFAHRLARENGWTLRFAKRALDEYRKFVFLAMEAGHPVTPSDEVDQAWHLHLTYSDAYARLNALLPRPLLHNPTKGGQAEDDKFEDWYAKTKESYRRYFGEPPEDLWPNSETRFGRAPHFRRVNVEENFIVSKAKLRRLAISGAALCLLATAIGCTTLYAQAAQERESNALMTLLVVVGVAVILLYILFSAASSASRKENKQNHSGCGSACGSTFGDSGHSSSGCGSQSHDSSGCGSSGCGSSGCGSSGCGSSGCGGGGCSS